jgi:DNA-directed RNA polymerase subunit RPC12/RpoP
MPIKSDEFALQVVAKGSFIDQVEDFIGAQKFVVETVTVRLNPAALNGWILSDMANTRECYEDGSEGDKQWEAHKIEYAERRKNWEAQVVNALGIDINSDSDSISITQAQSEIFTVVHIRKIEDTTALEAVEPADVEPVVHAHWLIGEHEFFDCSACGESYYTGAESKVQAESYLISRNFYKRCPYCGAHMDEMMSSK